MKIVRMLSIALLFAILSVFLPRTALAANEIAVDRDRFMCETVSSADAELALTERGTVLVSFRGIAPSLYADVLPDADAQYGNALRIVLANDSYCNLLSVQYTCDGEVHEQHITIERLSEKQDYFLYLQNAGDVTDIRLTFSGSTNGTIELFGLGIVSVYDDGVEQPGEITECTYDADAKTVTVSGNIRHDIVAGLRGATIVLYSFGVNDRVNQALLAAAKPIATQLFSVRFEFSVSAISFSERFAQYVVAITDETGHILHWYSPTVPCTPSDDSYNASAFKGVSTGHTSVAVSADVDFAIVDVYLDRMQSEKNNGLLHAADGTYFYINRSYIYELDGIINQYGKDGCSVYLRFLLDGGSDYNVLHGSTPSSVGAVYNGISLSGDIARLTLFAYTDFLCQRYAGENEDRIGGIILGYSVDRAAEYNYVGSKTLAEYTELYATALYVISEATKKSNTDVELVVPLSDFYDQDGGAIGRTGRYPARLFLVSLCKMIEDRFDGAFSLRVLLESRALPRLLAADGSDRSLASVDNLADWETVLAILSKRYGVVGRGYFYCWRPVGELSPTMLSGAYVYSYYKLFMSQAEGFILAADDVGEPAALRALFDTVKYINTQQGAGKNRVYLSSFGVTAWSELIPLINPTALVTREIYVSDAHSLPMSSVRGSYVMWDHQQGRSTYDWSASADCPSLQVYDVDGIGRSLVVTVAGEESCSEIVYAYAANGGMDVVDMLSADVMILGEAGHTYELTLEVYGERSACVVKADIESGRKTTVCVSTEALDKNDSVKNIRFFCSPADGKAEAYKLCIGQLAAHSNSLGDRELEEAMVHARLSSSAEDGDDETAEEKDAAWQLKAGVIVLVLCVSGAIVLTLARRNDE